MEICDIPYYIQLKSHQNTKSHTHVQGTHEQPHLTLCFRVNPPMLQTCAQYSHNAAAAAISVALPRHRRRSWSAGIDLRLRLDALAGAVAAPPATTSSPHPAARSTASVVRPRARYLVRLVAGDGRDDGVVPAAARDWNRLGIFCAKGRVFGGQRQLVGPWAQRLTLREGCIGLEAGVWGPPQRLGCLYTLWMPSGRLHFTCTSLL